MRKDLVLLSFPLLLFGVLRIFAPPILFRFAGLDDTFAVFAIVVASSVLVLTNRSWERIDFRSVFTVAALLCFLLAFVLINSPTLWGIRSTYLSLLDIFVVLNSGLLFSLAALEIKHNSLPVVTAVAVYTQLLIRRFRTTGTQFGNGWQLPSYHLQRRKAA